MTVRIVDLEIYNLKAKVKRPFEWGDGRAFYRTSSIIRIETSDGQVGWGPGSPVSGIAERLIRILTGQNPVNTGVLWEKMRRANIPINILGSVDIALWDLKGKILGLPVHELLGGAIRRCIPAYATGGYYPVEGDELDWLKGCIDSAMNRGFQAYKMKVGGRSFGKDVERLRFAREMLGENRKLMVDATTVYDLPAAKRMGSILEKLNVTWFEDPLPSDDFEGYKMLSQSLSVAVTAHYGARAPYPLVEHIKRRTVHQVQPSIEGAGGFTGSMKILHLAQFRNVICMPSCWATDLHIAATLHFLAAMPSLSTQIGDQPPVLEYDTSENPLREAVLKNPINLRLDGKVEVPDKPGLGVEVNPEALEKFRI